MFLCLESISLYSSKTIELLTFTILSPFFLILFHL